MVKTEGTATSPRAYRGVAADERRARRRAALLDAALDLLAADGAAAVTKRAVCARAKLNDRYFYEQFADRDAVLTSLVEELTAEGIAAVVAATHAAEPDIRSQVHAAADAALGFLLDDPRRHALLLNAHSTEALQRARLATQHAIARAMAAVSRELRPSPMSTPLDTDMAAYTVVSGTLELVAAWLRGEFDTTRAHLTDLIARQLLQVETVPGG
ncbi:TetR family transcriptional regulator [Nocardia ignorata]|uniref:TetR family transcriptional regulator n=1 Tax=Nocardia ignorata TaxID=145285 RepID=A0A4R6P6L0_NOCIG|nr:TetR family transcriptional regulator [Nocardia ignorata]TDP32966.1 TetR family transcriptional regulator [Nocardia ignorata]